MRFKNSLIVLSIVVPLVSYAGDDSGWTDNTRSKMVEGCTDSIIENVVATYKKQSGLSASAALPAEVQKGLEEEIIPEVRKTCVCTVEKVEAEHTYKEVESDISIMQRAGASIGTPEGCPLNI